MLDRIRAACAAVAERARFVRVDEARVAEFSTECEWEPPDRPVHPAQEPFRPADDEATVALVVTLDAVNFGSGWHPVLRKRSGLSGAMTVATNIREAAERDGPPTAARLAALTADECAAITGQDPQGPAAELVALWTRSLNDLGRFVARDYGGAFTALVSAAGCSAARLLQILDRMPLYHDVSDYEGVGEIPFYKRAQITSHDLALAFAGRGPGRIDDHDRLTVFADNLIPHVLRVDGVLVFDDELAARIDREELLPHGSPEEVELRAAAVHAVELLAAGLRDRGRTDSPADIDELLWRRGAAPRYKAVPRPRCRTAAY